MSRVLPRGLYAVTPDEPDTLRLAGLVEAALAGGTAILQYRNKAADANLKREQARLLLALCRSACVPLIINDDLALTLEIDADGVHLGGDDGDLATARAALGPHKLLGSSCYGSLERARAAQSAGADHIAFGAMFPSRTKPHAMQPPLGIFAEANREIGLPAVAIGGITLANAPELVRAGAHAVAVISAIFDAEDVRAEAAAFARLF